MQPAGKPGLLFPASQALRRGEGAICLLTGDPLKTTGACGDGCCQEMLNPNPPGRVFETAEMLTGAVA